MSNNTLYTFCGIDYTDTIYIYRYDKNGSIYRALITDDHYTRIDPALVPRNIWVNFAIAAKAKWSEYETIAKEPVAWSLPENNADTGITFEEFKALVLQVCPGSFYDDKDNQFKIIMKSPSGNRTMLLPRTTLRHIASHNRYFEDAPWK
jgi:hypothetical protein